MVIRKITLDEIQGVFQLIGEFNRKPAPDPSTEKVEQIFHQLTQSGGFVVGAFDNDRMIGTCTFNLCHNFSWSGAPFAMLENMVITEAYRNKGIGKAMMAFIDQECLRLGCYKVMVTTGVQREAAIRFYQSAGYQANKAGLQKRF
ncbi:GNAT family N-acetyltransferase [Parendozoicomonas haliclonae]|uniref:Putative acetyltransferase n=1 Tax=Parendozoicomonas haliclonae TaxID=1960125 RepID=A0A1X7AF69_9GAMM|nr:GNAT family N-acetyltransferase [Parendozoicomonas haliclonae]SMA34818.1 putative acetyltransferase [Parendozoicomonas haliclonae]